MGRSPAPAIAVALLLAACAPKEATYDISEQAAAAAPPALLPTEFFETRQAEGVAGTERLGADRSALEGRAAALRGRAAALSAAEPIPAEDRARLEAAQDSGG